MFCIPSATENIIMKVPQKILNKTFSATLAYNGISIRIFLSHLLSSVFSSTLGLQIFSEALPVPSVHLNYTGWGRFVRNKFI